MSMPSDVVEFVGDESTLRELREVLLADPVLRSAEISEPSQSRQFGVAEVVIAILIHLPTGVAAHYVYDKVKSWTEATGKMVSPKGTSRS